MPHRLSIVIQDTPFDPAAEAAKVSHGNPKVGGVVTFLGLMRDLSQGEPVRTMRLEHYPGMTEKALESIARDALSRWSLEAVRIVHRVGELHPQDPIVLVAVASQHRGDGFRACEFIIDYLKTRAPFWKKERTAHGERWVEPQESDTEAISRWEGPGIEG